MDTIRVFIVDDHPLVRDALRHIISREQELEFAGESDGTGDVSALVEAMQPQVVLMDYRLPVATGDILTKALKESLPHVRVFGISSDTEMAREKMMAAGADGVLEKTDVVSTLEALRQLARRTS